MIYAIYPRPKLPLPAQSKANALPRFNFQPDTRGGSTKTTSKPATDRMLNSTGAKQFPAILGISLEIN